VYTVCTAHVACCDPWNGFHVHEMMIWVKFIEMVYGFLLLEINMACFRTGYSETLLLKFLLGGADLNTKLRKVLNRGKLIFRLWTFAF
jgi:hypothetical protein